MHDQNVEDEKIDILASNKYFRLKPNRNHLQKKHKPQSFKF